MGKGKFVRVSLRRTQEKLERVLETNHQSGLRMIDSSSLNSYKRVEGINSENAEPLVQSSWDIPKSMDDVGYKPGRTDERATLWALS